VPPEREVPSTQHLPSAQDDPYKYDSFSQFNADRREANNEPGV